MILGYIPCFSQGRHYRFQGFDIKPEKEEWKHEEKTIMLS